MGAPEARPGARGGERGGVRLTGEDADGTAPEGPLRHTDRVSSSREPSASEVRGALTRSAVVYMILFSAVGCWSAYASVLFKEQGVGLAVIGLLASVPAAVSIVGAPTWGLVADRLGDVRPPLLVAGLWAAAAASLLALQPPMPWTALVVAILAAGSSGLTPLVDARTVERLGRARDRFGQARAFGSLGFILATLGVGVLVQAIGTTAMLAVYVPALALTGVVGAAVLGAAPARRVPRASARSAPWGSSAIPGWACSSRGRSSCGSPRPA